MQTLLLYGLWQLELSMQGVHQDGKLCIACAISKWCAANRTSVHDILTKQYFGAKARCADCIYMPGGMLFNSLILQPSSSWWGWFHSAFKLRGFSGVTTRVPSTLNALSDVSLMLFGIPQHKHKGCCLVSDIETWSCAGITRSKHCHTQCSTGALMLLRVSRWWPNLLSDTVWMCIKPGLQRVWPPDCCTLRSSSQLTPCSWSSWSGCQRLTAP